MPVLMSPKEEPMTLIAEDKGNGIVHLIRKETSDVVSFSRNRVPFKELKECGLAKKDVLKALSSLNQNNKI